MRKVLKILTIVLAIAVVTLVIAVIVLPLVVDPNQYKDDIVQLVKEKTGRDLKIEGKIGLSIFPSIGLETGRMQLGNARGFGKQAFARIDNMAVHVALMPLLRKQIVVQGVRLEGLELNLARNRRGRTNWEDLGKPAAKTQKSAPPPPAPAMAAAAPALHVNRIRVRKANASLRDAQSGTSYAVHNLDLTANNVAPGAMMDLALGFELEIGKPAVRERIKLDTRVNVDPERQTLDIPALSLAVGELQLEASVKGTKILDAPALSGTVEIKNFSARGLLDKFAATPDTADKTALNKLSLRSGFDATADSVSLKNLNLAFDDSRLTGTFSVRRFSRPAYKFKLVLNRLDLDRYLPAPAPPGQSAQSGAPAAAQPVEIPLGALRELNANGELRIDSLKATGIRSSDVNMKIAARGGLITLGPNRAKLYRGAYAGKTVIDARGKVPAYRFDEQLKGIQIGPFLKDIDVFDRYSGTGTLAFKLNAQGLDAGAVTRSLNGTVSVALRDGKVSGVNLEKTIKTARALYDKTRNKEISVNPAAGDETAFKSLTATFVVTNGTVRNSDLVLAGPVVRGSGKGDADLVRDRMDYRLNVTLAEDATRQGTTVPLKIHGKLSKPSFTIDFSALVKQKVDRKIEREKEKVQEKVRDKLRDKLKNLFNR